MNHEQKKKYIEEKLASNAHAGLISTAELADALNIGRTKAREYTYGLQRYVGHRYLLLDVIERILDDGKF